MKLARNGGPSHRAAPSSSLRKCTNGSRARKRPAWKWCLRGSPGRTSGGGWAARHVLARAEGSRTHTGPSSLDARTAPSTDTGATAGADVSLRTRPRSNAGTSASRLNVIDRPVVLPDRLPAPPTTRVGTPSAASESTVARSSPTTTAPSTPTGADPPPQKRTPYRAASTSNRGRRAVSSEAGKTTTVLGAPMQLLAVHDAPTLLRRRRLASLALEACRRP